MASSGEAVNLTDIKNSLGSTSGSVSLTKYAAEAGAPTNQPLPLSQTFAGIHPALNASTPCTWSYGIRRLYSTYLRPTIEIVRESDSQTAVAWFEPYEEPLRILASDGQRFEGPNSLSDWANGATVRILKFFDQTGNGHYAALSSKSAYGAELVKQDGKWAAYFDGVEPVYAIDHFFENGIQAVSNTAEVWIPDPSTLATNGDNGYLIAYDRSMYHRMEAGICEQGSSYPTFTYTVNNSDESSGYELRTQQWTHLAAGFDIQGQDFYVDGRLVRTVARSGGTDRSIRYGLIGTNSEATTYDISDSYSARFKGYFASLHQYPARISIRDLVQNTHIESGITEADGNFKTVPFHIPFPDGLAPVVVPCVAGNNRFTCRIGKVTSNDFTIKLERGDTGTSFETQQIHWVAFPPPEVLSTGFLGNMRFETHRYTGQNRVVPMRKHFSQGIALAAVQSVNSSTATFVRGRNANDWTTDSVDLEMMTVDGSQRVDEVIGLVVLENAQGPANLTGIPVAENGGTVQTLQVTTPDTTNVNYDFVTVNYARPMITSPTNTPVAIGFISTRNGEAVQVHVQNINRNSCEVAAKEPFNKDGPHVNESAHVLVLPAGAHHVQAAGESAMLWHENFAHNDLGANGWTVNDANFTTTNPSFGALSGTYVAGIEADSTAAVDIATISPGAIKNASNGRVAAFSFAFYEKSASHGGGVRLFNGANEDICSFVTQNPEWTLDDGDGFNVIFSGNGYDRWVRVLFIFNWSRGMYAYNVDDGTTIKTGLRRLATRNTESGIDTIKIANLSTVQSGYDASTAMYMWFDDFVAWPPSVATEPSRIWWEGFEHGHLSKAGWEVIEPNFQVSQPSFVNSGSGKSVAGIKVSETSSPELARITPSVLKNTADGRIVSFSYRFYEFGPTSTGGGIRLYDDADAHVCSFASDNPQWHLFDGDGNTEIKGDDSVYETWTFVKFTFDWRAGTYDYEVDDGSTRRTGTRNLDSSQNVRKIVISNFNSVNDFSSTEHMDMYFDDLRIELPAQSWASATELRDATNGTAPSGVYKIRWDGVNPYDIYCDMDLEGGGWMMILNYVHKGGTNPNLNVRTDSFPQNDDTSVSGGDNVYIKDGFHVHEFRNSGTIHVNKGGEAELLVVGGGGSGGGGGPQAYDPAGGGGGGEVVHLKGVSMQEGANQVTVGKGGAKVGVKTFGNQGGTSSVFGIQANGGGGGARGRSSGLDGGSGGGEGRGGGTPGSSQLLHPEGMGNAGGPSETDGGGGGGATETGVTLDGGEGYSVDITGATEVYGSGGGGGTRSGTIGKGGTNAGDGGGEGKPGKDGTGSGGGGGEARGNQEPGGAGGSGIVIVRYTSLGKDQSGTSSWGHISQALAAKNDFNEYMFYGKTSNHNRVIHFRGSWRGVIDYIKGNGTTMDDIENTFTMGNLVANSPNLPEQGSDHYTDKGDLAMTDFPFFNSGNTHWGIKGDGNRWEVDDNSAGSNYDTIHRIWVRRLPEIVLGSKGAASVPLAVYGTRKLTTSTSPHLRIQRSSDGENADIYYDTYGNVIEVVSVSTGQSYNTVNDWLSASGSTSDTLYVVKWYDQSGNDHHMTTIDHPNDTQRLPVFESSKNALHFFGTPSDGRYTSTSTLPDLNDTEIVFRTLWKEKSTLEYEKFATFNNSSIGNNSAHNNPDELVISITNQSSYNELGVQYNGNVGDYGMTTKNPSKYQLHNSVYNKTNSRIQYYIDNKMKTDSSATLSTLHPSYFGISQLYNKEALQDTYVTDLMVYDKVLPPGERNSLYTHLM